MSGKLGLVAAAALLGSVLAMPTAQARDVGQIFTECGLGGMLASESPMSASITNVTTSSGTYATTTNSISPELCADSDYRSAVFIKESFSALETDLAVGKGEHLAALNSIMGCEYASQNLRKEYADYATSTAYNVANTDEKVQQMFNIVERHLSSSACNA